MISCHFFIIISLLTSIEWLAAAILLTSNAELQGKLKTRRDQIVVCEVENASHLQNSVLFIYSTTYTSSDTSI